MLLIRIYSFIILSIVRKSLCIDENDVSMIISAVQNGQPIIARLEGNPDVWAATLWEGGEVSLKTLRGESSSHLFKKLSVTYPGRKLIWSNSVKGDIEYMQMLFGSTNQTYSASSAHIYTSTEIGGITVDWTTNNIYWTDQIYNWIMMAKIGVPNLYRVIINTGLQKPGGIRVHPAKSLLFWSEYGTSPKIETSNLLGEQRKTIVGSNIIKPVAIDIDFSTNMLYWIDTSKSTIERCALDGTNRNTFTQGSFVSTLIGLVVYKSYVFAVSDQNKLYLMNMTKPGTPKVITMEYTKAFDVYIFGEIKQPKLASPCSNTLCNEYCVGKNDNSGYQCACSHGKDLILNSCLASSYISHPVYIYTMSQSICWYHVWTPHMTNDQLTHKCYVEFTSHGTHYLASLLSIRYLYFGSGTNIYAVPLQKGGSISILINNAGLVKGVSVDWISKNIYWSDGTAGSIKVANSNGRYIQEIISSLPDINGLVVNPISGYIYWISNGNMPYIGKTLLNGETKTNFVTSGLSSPQQLAFDFVENRLYWTDNVKDVIESINADGSGRRVVITATNSQPFGISIFQDHIIWTDRTTTSPGLYWAYKDGRGLVKNVQRVYDTGTVILYGDYSQPPGHTNGCSSINGGCAQLCLPKESGRICKCGLGYELDTDGKNCSIKSSSGITNPLIIIDTGQFTFIKMDAVSYALAIIPVTGLQNPVALDVDTAENLMFWTDVKTKRIMKASLDGSNQATVKILPSTSVPDGLAVDDSTKTIFYTDQNRNLIATIDYNGNNEMILINQGLDEPRAIILDIQNRRMYWTDWGLKPNIMSATYKGESKQTIVQSTNLKWPNGLTLDVQAQIIYWCDGSLGRIESIKTDGTDRKLLAAENGAHYFSLTLFGNNLYVTDWKSRYIKKLHKSGGMVQSVGSPVFIKAYGIISLKSKTISTETPLTTTSATTTTILSTTTRKSTATTLSTTTPILTTTTEKEKQTITTQPNTISIATISSTIGLTTTKSTSTNLITEAVPTRPPTGNSTMIIVIAMAVGGFVILSIVVTTGIVCCLKKRRARAAPQNRLMNMNELAAASNGDTQYQGLYDHNLNPPSTILDDYVHPVGSIKTMHDASNTQNKLQDDYLNFNRMNQMQGVSQDGPNFI